MIEGTSSSKDRAISKEYLIDLIEKEAIKLIDEKREELLQLLSRTDMTFWDVGNELLGSEFHKAVIPLHIARTAALKILSPEAYDSLVKKNIALGVQRRGGEKWSDDELSFVKEALANPQYFHGQGAINEGHPDWTKICEALNAEVHKGLNQRTPEMVRAVVYHQDIYKAKERNVPWSDEELRRLAQLKEDPHFFHTEGTQRAKPNWKRIAHQMNLEFHGDELALGVEVRTLHNCSAKLQPSPDKKRSLRKWTPAEIRRLQELAEDPLNTKTEGTNRSMDWEKIVTILNAEFPPLGNQNTFTIPSCKNQFQRHKR